MRRPDVTLERRGSWGRQRDRETERQSYRLSQHRLFNKPAFSPLKLGNEMETLSIILDTFIREESYESVSASQWWKLPEAQLGLAVCRAVLSEDSQL